MAPTLNTESAAYVGLNHAWPPYLTDPGTPVADLRNGANLSGLDWAQDGGKWWINMPGNATAGNGGNVSTYIPEAMTVGFRTKLRTVPGSEQGNGFIAKRNGTDGYLIYMYEDQVVFHTFANGSGVISGGNLSADTWYDIVCTHGPTGFAIHVNSTQVASGSYVQPIGTNSNDLIIGQDGAGNYADGLIGDIRIYDRVLSGAEITAFSETDDLIIQPTLTPRLVSSGGSLLSRTVGMDGRLITRLV